MSGSDVTVEGLAGTRRDREALIGVNHIPQAERNGRAGKRRAGRRGEESPVEEAEFSSYYGKPVVKEPTWAALDIAGYLFLGGLAGASSVFAAGAELSGRPALARRLKLGAAGSISLSLVALVHDLGRPARFLNMLRVFKVTSPMSVGVWILSVYAPAASAAALGELRGLGRLRPLGRLGTVGAAVLGPAVASYTSVLISDTATPAWHEGHREMPFVFVASAASAAAGLGLLAAPLDENAPARRLALIGAVAEISTVKLLERRVGIVAEAYHHGRAGTLMRAAEALTLAGVAGALSRGHRSRRVAALSGAALMAASACARFGIFEAGRQSARDPKYTVLPQRERSGAARSRSEDPPAAAGNDDTD
jgi:formate-dependent nitrite reductase membrane component NrfD